MNAYDFDKTIYNGDSTVDFYIFCIKNQPSLLRYLPCQLLGFIKYILGLSDKTAMKELFYRFLRGIDEVDLYVNRFWESHFHKIAPWYAEKKSGSDVIISASPEFLLKPACARLGVAALSASRVDKKTGLYSGKNCRAEEKLVRFRELFGEAEIDEFYSDSFSDAPLAGISRKSYIVKGDRQIPWEQAKTVSRAKRGQTDNGDKL